MSLTFIENVGGNFTECLGLNNKNGETSKRKKKQASSRGEWSNGGRGRAGFHKSGEKRKTSEEPQTLFLGRFLWVHQYGQGSLRVHTGVGSPRKPKD